MDTTGRKTHLKLRFVSETPMSKEGYKHWTPKLRLKLHKMVYGKGDVFCYGNIPVEAICSKQAIGEFARDNLYEGSWIMLGYSHGKTKTHVKLVALCRIILKSKNNKYTARVTLLKRKRLSRYWFWEK